MADSSVKVSAIRAKPARSEMWVKRFPSRLNRMPSEVFSNADGYDVTIGTPGPGRTLETNRRFALTDAVPIAEITGPIDTLIIAGGPGAETDIYDPSLSRGLKTRQIDHG